jgi:hypothetical protein
MAAVASEAGRHREAVAASEAVPASEAGRHREAVPA